MTTTTHEPEFTLDNFFTDFCFWSASLDGVKWRYITPAQHRERWTEQQDAAYVDLMVAMDAALAARYGPHCDFTVLAEREDTYGDLFEQYPEVFGEDPEVFAEV